MIRVFISSVQKEFAAERAALAAYLDGDPLLRRFFETFVFERDVPASDRRPDAVYLDEVRACDLYLGLFGDEYGWENPDGLSPTHLEFNEATRLGKTRLIFVKGATDDTKHPKMRALLRDAGASLIRRRFNSAEELIAAIYASLVRILEERELIRFGPFDATFCRNATLADLDDDKIARFLDLARRGRNFPLPAGTPPLEVLAHLNLLDQGRPTHAAVLLFGRQPQRFLLTSEVKCAHFHGYEVAKPIPSYQVYKGTVFDLVDQAKDFVLSKIDLWVGTRATSTQVPTAYEIPQEVVAEAIVNAVVHRDYTSNASVQVMLFKDRLEIWNPGSLPPSLTLEKLSGPHASVPHNPLLAEPMYLTKYIERMGTGIRDMIRRCQDAGLRAPEIRLDGGSFVLTIWRKVSGSNTASPSPPGGVSADLPPPPVTPPVTPPVAVGNLLRLIGSRGPLGNSDLLKNLGLRDRTHLREHYIDPALAEGLVERTLPDKPTSRLQKYRLTAKGRAVLDSQASKA